MQVFTFIREVRVHYNKSHPFSRDHLIESLTQTKQVDIMIFQPIMLGRLPYQNDKQPSMYQRLLASTY